VSKLKWARWQSVEQAGESFLAQRLSRQFGLNIAEAAVSPFFLTELKRANFNRRLRGT
jgi:hypothetical protein